MTGTSISGKVQTVLGPIEPDRLGVTLTHEHLLIDLMCYFQMPAEASEREWVGAPIEMDRLGRLARNLCNIENFTGGHHEHRGRTRPPGTGPHLQSHGPEHHHGRRLLRPGVPSA